MLLAKAVEQFYQQQVAVIGRCPECGGNMQRLEAEEYGRCWLCHQEAGENADQRGN